MRDTELYRHLLGLVSPWSVSRVELHLEEQRIDVYAAHHSPKTWPCPACGKACRLHDHDAERTWRHLDSCQFKTLLHARIPRVDCPQHGVRQVQVPWAEPRSRFTTLFECFAIDVLLVADIKGAAKILGISWDEAHHLMERAVERGLARRPHVVPKRLGVDEKSIAKGQTYATVSTDLDTGIVLEVAEGRTKQSVFRSLGRFSLESLSHVEAVAMDMSPTYRAAIRACVAGADEKIVFDRFHIVQHMNHAVDRVRRRENKQLVAEGDETLVGTTPMWRYGRENLPEKYRPTFAELKDTTLKTARAWAIKEQLRDLWDQPSEQAATDWWKRWYFWATHSRLDPVKTVAKMIRDHLPNVLTFFTHRITNATTEAINGVIQTLSKRAYGFRNFDHFRTAVLFRCGGFQLYPALA